MEDLARILATHPFLASLTPDQVAFVVGCARNARFRPGEYLLRQGDHEDKLFLIREGTVSIELPGPGGEVTSLETLGPGDVLGVSLLTPSAADLDCRARDAVRAFEFDNACLLRKMQEDPALGYGIAMRLLELTYRRLARLRLQNLDVYR